MPILTATEFKTLAWILTGFLIASTLVGLIWAPRHEGKSLEEIERERSTPGVQTKPVRTGKPVTRLK